MKIKRFVAKDIRQAMKMVKDELGADAVIMSNRSVEDGVEIVAARDFDEEVIHDSLKSEPKPAARPKKSMQIISNLKKRLIVIWTNIWGMRKKSI
jgi:flagellar biosynthesis protein FlhF